jgi:hypothetical protein
MREQREYLEAALWAEACSYRENHPFRSIERSVESTKLPGRRDTFDTSVVRSHGNSRLMVVDPSASRFTVSPTHLAPRIYIFVVMLHRLLELAPKVARKLEMIWAEFGHVVEANNERG